MNSPNHNGSTAHSPTLPGAGTIGHTPAAPSASNALLEALGGRTVVRAQLAALDVRVMHGAPTVQVVYPGMTLVLALHNDDRRDNRYVYSVTVYFQGTDRLQEGPSTAGRVHHTMGANALLIAARAMRQALTPGGES